MVNRLKVPSFSGKSPQKLVLQRLNVTWPWPQKPCARIPLSALAEKHFAALRAFDTLSTLRGDTFLSRGTAYLYCDRRKRLSARTRLRVEDLTESLFINGATFDGAPSGYSIGRKYLNLYAGSFPSWTPAEYNETDYGLFLPSKLTWLESEDPF